MNRGPRRPSTARAGTTTRSACAAVADAQLGATQHDTNHPMRRSRWSKRPRDSLNLCISETSMHTSHTEEIASAGIAAITATRRTSSPLTQSEDLPRVPPRHSLPPRLPPFAAHAPTPGTPGTRTSTSFPSTVDASRSADNADKERIPHCQHAAQSAGAQARPRMHTGRAQLAPVR